MSKKEKAEEEKPAVGRTPTEKVTEALKNGEEIKPLQRIYYEYVMAATREERENAMMKFVPIAWASVSKKDIPQIVDWDGAPLSDYLHSVFHHTLKAAIDKGLIDI